MVKRSSGVVKMPDKLFKVAFGRMRFQREL